MKTILSIFLIILFLLISITSFSADDQRPLNPHKEKQKVIDLNLKIMNKEQALLAADLITEYYDYLCNLSINDILKEESYICDYLEDLISKYSKQGLKICKAGVILQKEKITCELRVVVKYEYETGNAFMIYYIHKMKQIKPNCDDELKLKNHGNEHVIRINWR